MFHSRRKDYLVRRALVEIGFGWEQFSFEEEICALYVMQKLSAQQISDEILHTTKESISPRSIQRILKRRGEIRTNSEARALLESQGRGNHPYKKFKIRRKGLPRGLRGKLLEEAGYKCALCGCGPSTHKGLYLEVDHIIPVCRGGKNTPENLRILCQECNDDKQFNNKEV